jgi:MFS family permease
VQPGRPVDDSALDSAPHRASHRRYVVMAFLCVLSFLTYFDRVCISRAQEDIQGDLGISDVQMGFIFGAFFLAYSLFEIPGGWMGDRYGSRITLTRIVLAWSLFTVLSGSAVGFWSLLAWRFLFGVGEAGAYPNMARVQARWLPVRSRARAGGLLWLMARWGGAFSGFLFGLMLRFFNGHNFREALVALHLPAELPAWRMAFWAAGLVGVVWCLAFYPWFRDDPADMRSVNDAELRLIRAGEGGPSESHSMPPEIWRALLKSPGLWAMGALYIFNSFGWSFFVTWLPRYLEDVYQVKFHQSELMSGMPLFIGGISCLVGGALCDAFVRRTGRKRLGRALFPVGGFATAATAMACVPLTSTPEQATILICVASAGVDFGQGANWATIVDLGGRYAGTAAGFINMVGNAGSYLQPVLGAQIFGHFGWNTLMGVYATSFVAAAAMWLFIDPRRPFYGEDSADNPDKSGGEGPRAPGSD